jgi:hypothetical protein
MLAAILDVASTMCAMLLLLALPCRQVAEYLHAQSHFSSNGYKGICYFNSEEKQWTILSQNGSSYPREASPIAERDCFTIFDDARCRGADLQLQQQAVGLLTLAPEICKDKLMQAAGRMRQLGLGRQTLHVVGTPDVTDKIRAANTCPEVDKTSEKGNSKSNSSSKSKSSSKSSSNSSSSSRKRVNGPTQDVGATGGGVDAVQMQHVLQWVMANTVEANQHGVVQWAGHGLHFAVTQGAPERAWLDEKLEVKELYGSSQGMQPVETVVTAMVEKQLQRCNNGAGLGTAQQELLRTVEEKSVKYGEGYLVRTGHAPDEECERELEEEVDEEEEVEVEVPSAKARQEVDWAYAAAFTVANAAELGRDAGQQLHPLPGLAKQLLQPGSIGDIPWDAGVFATENFVYAVEQRPAPAGSTNCLNEYMRPVVEVLMLPSGEVVMLSEREAEGLLEQWLAMKGIGTSNSSSSGIGAAGWGAARSSAYLVSLGYALAADAGGGGQSLATALLPAAAAAYGMQQQKQQLLDMRKLMSMQLFDGGASFSFMDQRELQKVMRGRKEAAEALVSMRGKLPLFTCSDLEKACDE